MIDVFKADRGANRRKRGILSHVRGLTPHNVIKPLVKITLDALYSLPFGARETVQTYGSVSDEMESRFLSFHLGGVSSASNIECSIYTNANSLLISDYKRSIPYINKRLYS